MSISFDVASCSFISASRSQSWPDWTSLQPELVVLISEKLHSSLDYASFRLVCLKWCFSVPKTNFAPLLMLPFERKTLSLPFYDPSKDKIHQAFRPEIADKVILGCSLGWLAVIDKFHRMSLFNPVTRSYLPLPPATKKLGYVKIVPEWLSSWPLHIDFMLDDMPLPSFRCWSGLIHDVTLSRAPNTGGDCIVVMTLVESVVLVYCKLGEKDWSYVFTNMTRELRTVAFYEGRLFLVDGVGQVAICNKGPPEGAITYDSLKIPSAFSVVRFVEWKDDLLLIGTTSRLHFEEELDPHDDPLAQFIIYKLDTHSSGDPGWLKLESIEDSVLFFSMNFNSCFIGSNISGCKKNCIYFSDHNQGLRPSITNDYHMHVMEISDASWKLIPCNYSSEQQKCTWWIRPSML